MKYDPADLEYLKKLFYEIDCFNNVDEKKLNRSLNLFYGLAADDNPQWKKEFKDSVKCKGEITKKGKQKFTKIQPEDFKKVGAEEIIKQAFEKKFKINNQLKELYNIDSGFNSTIIYEAPPYLLSIKEKNGTLNNEFVAEFILDENCSSPYSDAIKGCFNGKEMTISTMLQDNKCGFFDVIPIPLPINSDLRNHWATEKKFVINEKRIFVHFFEWAIENYIKNAKIASHKKHKIAIGIPLNNAISLYEYYAPNKILEFGKDENLQILFNAPHSIDFAKKKSGLWIHPFKNCVISTSNTPNAELMKLALDIQADNSV
jgi:hypothetical protein